MSAAARTFLLLGAIACLLAVLLGAFGAHALRGKLTADALAIYQTAVQYHFWHALGLLAIGIVALHLPASTSLKWAGGLLAAGIVLFSGSLYLLAISGVRGLGAVTPIGGTAFIAGWALLVIAIARAPAG